MGHPLEQPRLDTFRRYDMWALDRLRLSGYRHTLELEFRVESVNLDEEECHKRFLPKFKEKGLVRVVEITSGRFREWP